MSAPAIQVPLPFLARCSALCGRGLWVQTEPWPVDTVLECTCGARAEVEICDSEGCGKPATYLWRDEIHDEAEEARTCYEVVNPGALHRACAEHRPPDTWRPRP